MPDKLPIAGGREFQISEASMQCYLQHVEHHGLELIAGRPLRAAGL